MSLLDGLKDSLKNPLAENNDEMEFILESDFETALEKAIDVKLSPADIAAILNGDDDIDDEEDDLDDDIDKDTIDDLQKAKEALEATMTEIGIDTAANELDKDDDTGDLDMDPEGEDEIISEEALIEMIDALECDDAQELPGDEAKITKKADTGDASIPENLKDPTPDGDEHKIGEDEKALEAIIAAIATEDTTCDIEKAKVTKVADTGESSIPKNSGKLPEDIDKLTHETGDASIPENTQDPTPDGDEHQIKKDEETLEALIAALESDDKPEIDHDPSVTECNTTETGAAGTLANSNDATPVGTEAENPGEDKNVHVNAITEEDDEESEECSLESILDSLLENPI